MAHPTASLGSRDPGPSIATFSGRWAAVLVLAGPLLLLAGMLWHPFLPDLRNKEAVVDALVADEARWIGSHFMSAVGGGLLLLSFMASRAFVHPTGREPWTTRAMVPLVLGTVLFAMLPAMEISVLASHRAGADALAVHHSVDTWFRPTMLASAVLMAVGIGLFAGGVAASRALSPAATRVVGVGLAVVALSRFIPSMVSLTIGAVAGVVAFAPLAAALWHHGADAPVPGRSRPVPGRDAT